MDVISMFCSCFGQLLLLVKTSLKLCMLSCIVCFC